MRFVPLLGVVLVLAGCGSGNDLAGGTTEDLPETIEAPAGASPAQEAAAEAQSPATGSAAAAEADTAPDAVADALEAKGMDLVTEETPEYTTYSLALTDDEGNPLPGADKAAARWSPFTLYVGADGKRIADLTEPGDVIPSVEPGRDGIVWREETDPIGDKVFTAYAFHGGGRIVVTTLGEGGRKLTPGFERLQGVLKAFD